MDNAQILFILAIFILAAVALKDIAAGRIDWKAAGVCLFVIAIYLA